MLFWESTRTRNLFNKRVLLGGILYGFSISALLLYSLERPYFWTGKLLAGVAQLIFYSYISLIAFHVIYLMNKLSKHKLIKNQMIVFTITAIIGYGFTDIFLLLTIIDVLNWRYVFNFYTALASFIVLLYIKNQLLFIYLPESLYESKDFRLEKIMLVTLNGALIWSSGKKDMVKKGLEDKLVSNLLTALELFGQETLRVKPKLNILSLRINDKIVCIKRYCEIQCVIIANKIPKIIEFNINKYLRKVHNVIKKSDLTQFSEDIINSLNKLFENEFRHILMLQGEE